MNVATRKSPKPVGPIGMSHPSLKSSEQIPFDSLQVSVDRFQIRNSGAGSTYDQAIKAKESIELVASLVRLIESGVILDPPIIWTDTEGARWVIDGHHRMEALVEVGGPPKRKLWVQRFIGSTEAEARDFAHQINTRLHLNMSAAENLDHYWRTALCGETVGSIRRQAARYRVSVSSVQRVREHRDPVFARLKEEAAEAGATFDVSYIRTNAPAWKQLATWRYGKETGGRDDSRARALAGMVKALAIRFTPQAKSQPLVLIDAFQEFYEAATGRAIDIRQIAAEALDGASRDF